MSKSVLKRAIRLCLPVSVIVGCTIATPSSEIIVGSGGARPAGWLADGSKLLVDSVIQGDHVIEIDGRSISRSSSPWNSSQTERASVFWSPDGLSILLERTEYGDQCINVNPPCNNLFRLDTPWQSASLIVSSIGMSAPAWSPDSQQFAVMVDTDLRIYNRDGQHYREVYVNTIPAHLAWSPDGRLIALSDDREVKLIDLGTDELVETGGFPRDGIQPTWSPNGKYIAYIQPSGFTTEGDLVVTSLNGQIQLTLAGSEDSSPPQADTSRYLYRLPMWSPRGDYIAVSRVNSNAPEEPTERYKWYETVLIPVPDDLKSGAVGE